MIHLIHFLFPKVFVSIFNPFYSFSYLLVIFHSPPSRFNLQDKVLFISSSPLIFCTFHTLTHHCKLSKAHTTHKPTQESLQRHTLQHSFIIFMFLLFILGLSPTHLRGTCYIPMPNAGSPRASIHFPAFVAPYIHAYAAHTLSNSFRSLYIYFIAQYLRHFTFPLLLSSFNHSITFQPRFGLGLLGEDNSNSNPKTFIHYQHSCLPLGSERQTNKHPLCNFSNRILSFLLRVSTGLKWSKDENSIRETHPSSSFTQWLLRASPRQPIGFKSAIILSQ
ncbi:hypothetical protein AMECASPLE_033963 [Ameca splendens]|uniref:Uncharacterized protein n=1 Tax=Ameca splendens TaxID=208324 RepID=A0ABV1ADD7_9TELE